MSIIGNSAEFFRGCVGIVWRAAARWGHAMAYDPGRGMTVLVGGKDLQIHVGLADVWAACAARPATARAPAIIRNTEASAAPVRFAMAAACASTPILPSAAPAAAAGAVKVEARVEMEEPVGRAALAAASLLAVRVVRMDPSSAELAAWVVWVAPFSAEWADAAAPAVSEAS
jgi:hypothetical protein